MIRRTGRQRWQNIHVTHATNLDDLIDIDNSTADGPQRSGFELLKQAARELDDLAQEAARRGRRIRALGSGWALTDIAITDGWLINTKMLNGCFDVSDRFFEPGYPSAKRPYLVVAQAGMSIGELNIHLEVTATPGFPRALKTSGIGAGQTIAGAISGNTHGSAINFGSTPDFVVGLQIVTGSGKSLWIERGSQPVLNDEFLSEIDAVRLRDDDIFDAAVVSFGAMGVITAVAIETEALYQLSFAPVNDITHTALKTKLDTFRYDDPPELYHYEFVFDPYSKSQVAMEAVATKVPFQSGHPAPRPVWIIRDEKGFAPGDSTPKAFFVPLLSAASKTAIQFKQYREKCILGGVRSTPGQLFMATVTYLEGYTESAIGVSIENAAQMIDISTAAIRRMKLPAMSQVRLVHPSKALLAFTRLPPKTAIFEFGLANNASFRKFENNLLDELSRKGIAYTLHWSKNSGIDPARLATMYGSGPIQKWRDARTRIFAGNTMLMRTFENTHLARAGLV